MMIIGIMVLINLVMWAICWLIDGVEHLRGYLKLTPAQRELAKKADAAIEKWERGHRIRKRAAALQFASAAKIAPAPKTPPREKPKDPLLQAFMDPNLSEEKFAEIFARFMKEGRR